MKKLHLEVEEEPDFLLFGLVSGHKASKLVFFVNQLPAFDFSRVEDIKLPDFNPKANTSFSLYAFHDEENHLDFHLLANKEFGLCLFNELRQFDFLLMVRGGIEFLDQTELTREWMKLQGIQLVAPIDPNNLKAKISWII